jgi:hypothetical protein
MATLLIFYFLFVIAGITGGIWIYKIFDKVAEAEKYRLYLCFLRYRQCLLQIANAKEFNGDLDRAAYLLGELKRRADELEAEYAKVKDDPIKTLSYDLQFPELVDSFIPQQQGGRRVNILAFRNVEDITFMVPIINITSRDCLRVDLRTSGWILGKLLKLLVLTQSEGISIGLISGNNILIEPDKHYVLIFDWLLSELHSDKLTIEKRRQEISQVAQAVITLIGGNPVTGIIPNDGDESIECYDDYTNYILRLARGNESNVQLAHEGLYKLMARFWHGYHPFTVKPLLP